MTTNTLYADLDERLRDRIIGLKKFFHEAGPHVGDFFTNAIGQVRVLKKAYPGLMHLLIFWGVTIQIIGTVINLLQMQLFLPFVENPFPRGNTYLGFELVMDLAGLMILLGVLMAAFRRGVIKPKTLETRGDDVYALVLLTLIPLVGFTLEGLRLVITNPAWKGWSPVGNLVAKLLIGLGLTPEFAGSAHSVLFWTHVVLGLGFIASIPFTKFRHLIMVPLNILAKPKREGGVLALIEDIEETEFLGVGAAQEFLTHQLFSFDACLNCGRCEEICPVACSGMDFSPRKFIQTLRETAISTLISPNGQNGHDGFIFTPDGTPWNCTTCGACLSQCPAFVNPVDAVIDLRRYHALTTGKIPRLVADVLRNLERQGNPWGNSPVDRLAWADGLDDVREIGPGESTDVLLFLGCVFAFDDRNRKVARSFVKMLQSLGVDFAILGMDEGCCGDSARRLGNEYLFQIFAEQNIEMFSQISFNRIVTQCPHCYNTLKNEYPQLGGNYPVHHYTEFLADLPLPNMPLEKRNGRYNGAVTYHDPCYLGRYNQIFTAPRDLLREGGTPVVEMPRRGMNSFCCGGGGGQMWMETDPDHRINQRRLEEAQLAGAGTVVTACPYCLLMFDDAIRSKGLGDEVQVKDIVEVMASTQKLEVTQ